MCQALHKLSSYHTWLDLATWGPKVVNQEESHNWAKSMQQNMSHTLSATHTSWCLCAHRHCQVQINSCLDFHEWKTNLRCGGPWTPHWWSSPQAWPASSSWDRSWSLNQTFYQCLILFDPFPSKAGSEVNISTLVHFIPTSSLTQDIDKHFICQKLPPSCCMERNKKDDQNTERLHSEKSN